MRARVGVCMLACVVCLCLCVSVCVTVGMHIAMCDICIAITTDSDKIIFN